MKRSNNNDIDRLFQSHFDMHDAPVRDREALWERINPKKSRTYLPIILLIGLMTAMGFSYTLLVKDAKAVNIRITDYPTNDALSGSIATSDILSKKLDRLAAEQKNILPPTNNTQKNITEPLIFNAKSEKDQELKTNLNEGLSKVLSINAKSGLSEDRLVVESYNPKASSPKFIALSDSGVYHTGTNNTKMEKLPRTVSNIENIQLNLLNNSKDIIQISNSIEAAALPGLFKKDKNPLNDCKPGFGGHPYLDIYSILGMPLDQIGLLPGSEDQLGYLTDWSQRYTSLPSISMGIMLGYEFASGIDVAVGAEYQKMQSQYETIQTIVESITVFDPMAYFFYDDNNEVVWVGDSVTAMSTYDRTLAVANLHNLIHIPLQVSYPLIRRGPWNIKASGAIAVNLSLQYRGQFLRPDNSLVQVDNANQANYFAPNLGLSFELGGHLGYHLSPNWEAYISPRFRYNQQSYLSEFQLLSLSRNFVNLRMGVQYHF